jgi:hypothetical protein
VFFLHPTLLAEKDFPMLQHCVGPQGIYVLVLKLGWLMLSPPMLVEGQLRLYQQSSGVELAHLLVLMFLLTEARWGLRGCTVMPVASLRGHP